LLLGYRESLILILGLPAYAYAALFMVAGILKITGLFLHWGRFAHTIGVTVATFWSTTIIILAPSAIGWVGALPWVAIALITLIAVLWPPGGMIRTVELPLPNPAYMIDDPDPSIPIIIERNNHADDPDEC
jgi:hypothetical protein